MIGEWAGIPFQITTPEGTLLLNELDPVTGGVFQLDESKCSSGLPVRATSDNIPQGDGQITHRRWRGGYTAHLAVTLWDEIVDGDGEPACDTKLRAMLDHLGLHLNALLNPPNGGRLIWAPSGYADSRMIDQAQLLTAPTLSKDGALWTVEFDIDTPFPYYIDASEQEVNWNDPGGTGGDTQIITNAGNTDFYAVFHVFGPSTDFSIINADAVDDDGEPMQLVYDSSLPGAAAIAGGDFIFFDFFRNVAYRNGNLNNRKAGIDVRVSDFFPLVPGDNEITIIGADALIKWNNAWA